MNIKNNRIVFQMKMKFTFTFFFFRFLSFLIEFPLHKSRVNKIMNLENAEIQLCTINIISWLTMMHILNDKRGLHIPPKN